MTNEYLSSDFSYKKYSLKQLDNWVNDALNCEDLTPQDIYDTIVKCVDESVEYHKKYLTKSIDLLSLLKCQRPVDLDVTDKDWEDFWQEQDQISQNYTEEELNAMCDAAAKEEKERCREYNLREAEYYNKRAELDSEVEAIKAEGGYEWTPAIDSKSKEYWEIGRNKTYEQMIADGFIMTDDGFWIKDDKKKWVLPVEVDGPSGEFFITFPDSLLKEANLKEGDEVEWVDKGDGSCVFRKISKPLEMDNC